MWFHITLHPQLKLLGTYAILDETVPYTRAHEFLLPDEETYDRWVLRDKLRQVAREMKRLIKDVKGICKKYNITLVKEMQEIQDG